MIAGHLRRFQTDLQAGILFFLHAHLVIQYGGRHHDDKHSNASDDLQAVMRQRFLDRVAVKKEYFQQRPASNGQKHEQNGIAPFHLCRALIVDRHDIVADEQ
jgi:hypothetical protein